MERSGDGAPSCSPPVTGSVTMLHDARRSEFPGHSGQGVPVPEPRGDSPSPAAARQACSTEHGSTAVVLIWGHSANPSHQGLSGCHYWGKGVVLIQCVDTPTPYIAQPHVKDVLSLKCQQIEKLCFSLGESVYTYLLIHPSVHSSICPSIYIIVLP